MATSTARKQPIGLLDLPKEIRNNIYELCLTVPEEVCMMAEFSELDYDYELHITEDGSDRISSTRANFQPAILATCRTIHQEATPMFYGSNRFQLSLVFWEEDRHTICDCYHRKTSFQVDDDGTCFAWSCPCNASWPRQNGRNIEHLRTVRISEYTHHLLGHALHSLMSAWGLDELLTDYDPEFCMPAPAMAQMLLPLLRWLQVNRKPGQRPVMNVLDFVPVKEPATPWGPYRGTSRKEVHVAQLEDYAAKTRAILREELEDQRLCNSLWDINIT
jgi:hypothetical protein